MALSNLKTYKDWILRGEVCSLLHDVRKLSQDFVEYRQLWHAKKGNWQNDPHEKPFSTAAPEVLTGFDSLLSELKTQFCLSRPGGVDELSPNSVIGSHVNPARGVYEYALKRGDGLDAAQDRNNPLWSGEQTDRNRDESGNRCRGDFGTFYRSNVFGFEDAESPITAQSLEERRRDLFLHLQGSGETPGLFNRCWFKTPSAQDRRDFLAALRQSFESSCSDTTRPGNDTSMWEHTYAVASLTKALQAHYVIHGESQDGEKYFSDLTKPFMLWGLGWDGVRFIGRGQRLHDHGARRQILRNARAKCRERMEYDELLGNCVYEDDNAIVFLLPATQNCASYEQRLDWLKGEMAGDFEKASEFEIWPHFAQSEATQDTILLSQLLETLHTPELAAASLTGKRAAEVAGQMSWKIGFDLCSICGLRSSREKAEYGRICHICQNRRSDYAKEVRAEESDGPRQTMLISEIADGNRRCALLVGSFGLHDWLNGKMVRTLFVREARGLEAEIAELGCCADTKETEDEIKKSLGENTAYSYQSICLEIAIARRLQYEDRTDCTKRDLAKNFYFLYTQRAFGNPATVNQFPSDTGDPWRWDKVIDINDLANQICAKSPTPSTLLDVWETTQEFSQSICQALLLENAGLESRHRAVFDATLSNNFLPLPFEIWQGEVAGAGTVEFFFEEGDREQAHIVRPRVPRDGKKYSERLRRQLEDLRGQNVTKLHTPDGKSQPDSSLRFGDRCDDERYFPFREVIATPQVFMALVPANRAIPACDAIEKEFMRRFGKVKGRLPFSLGALFFDEHHPMFLVLDAGQRMLRNFRQLKSPRSLTFTGTDPNGETFNFKDEEGNRFNWQIPLQLGTGKPDYYHPYALVPDAQPAIKSYFPTPKGPVLHFKDLNGGMKIVAVPSVFDFQYLNSSASRFDLLLRPDCERRTSREFEGGLTLPIRLEMLQQAMAKTWQILQRCLTDASLRGIFARLTDKQRQWRVQFPVNSVSPTPAAGAWLALAEVELRGSAIPAEDHEFLLQQMKTGLFFETCRLYLQGARERVADRTDADAELELVIP